MTIDTYQGAYIRDVTVSENTKTDIGVLFQKDRRLRWCVCDDFNDDDSSTCWKDLNKETTLYYFQAQ